MATTRMLCAVLGVVVLAGAACSGSAGDAGSGPTTSTPYVVDPLEPGDGFVELDGNRYPFDGVICASGRLKDDPEGTERQFGVYANFEVDGTLAAVELTRYRSEIHDEVDTVPTLTDIAGVRMQGDDGILGLEAKRFQIIGQSNWQDPSDPAATGPLITLDGDRYEVEARFAGVGEQGEGGTPGRIAARCPDGPPAPPDSSDTPAPPGSTTRDDPAG